ncbi:MAG: hypothetical protein CSA55_02190 [Ilumatobacter coccineus]|uniref:Probable membrane transporter protein n=1 Tax=Ilumatobacter coccineus TaxID=467094 RepID=A0A2G6KC57_9ACTN|nr:MAG: hypothetical protein CSA55_02190 [Ilumatobacter coccineus]
MHWWDVIILVGGGIVAGLINAVAGGGSTLTVPLLVLAGVPGNAANGSNRVGVLSLSITAAAAFRRLGVRGLNRALPILIPVIVGSLVGSYGISQLTDEGFERLFGLLILPIVFLSLRSPSSRSDQPTWSLPVTIAVFSVVGLYGGAIQAGVGLVLLSVLSRAGYDLVTANNIKVVVVMVVTLVALPVFILSGNIRWLQAIILAIGQAIGGWIGAHAAVAGGEKIIRAFMVVAALALAAKLLGLYSWIGSLF